MLNLLQNMIHFSCQIFNVLFNKISSVLHFNLALFSLLFIQISVGNIMKIIKYKSINQKVFLKNMNLSNIIWRDFLIE